jgi:hypothetical protein
MVMHAFGVYGMAQVSKHVKWLGAGAKIPGSFCSPSSSSNLRGQPVYLETGSESQWKSGLSSELNSRKNVPPEFKFYGEISRPFSLWRSMRRKGGSSRTRVDKGFFANLATSAVGKSPV